MPKKNNREAVFKDMSFVDLHSHVLPCVDDGSESVEESLEILKAARACGVSLMIATPHFYAHCDTPERFLKRRNEAVRLLSEAVEKESLGESALPRLGVGAEVAFFGGMSRSSALESLCIMGTKLILIEMPFEKWTAAMVDELFGIKNKLGLTPVIAHVDRYIRHQTREVMSEVLSGELLIQMNAEALLCRSTRSICLELLSAGEVDFLGSDCHDLSDRSPDMSAAFDLIERKLGKGILGELAKFGAFALEDAALII